MALPTFVAASLVGVNDAVAVTPTIPVGTVVDDVLLMPVESVFGETVTIPTPNGGTWTQVTGSPVEPSAGTRLTVFWSRYNGTQGNPTTNDPGDHISAIIMAFRGCETSGDPWDVVSTSIDGAIDTSMSAAGATTTVPDCLVVVMACTGADAATPQFSAWANADLAGVTERVDFAGIAGNGGGVGAATGEKASAGAYGATTATYDTASRKGMMTLALKPPQAAPAGQPYTKRLGGTPYGRGDSGLFSPKRW